MPKSLKRMTLNELRAELELTRPAWELELRELGDFLADGLLPALSADARRHQLVRDEIRHRAWRGG